MNHFYFRVDWRNEEKEDWSEVEEKNHVKTGEKHLELFSNQTESFRENIQ